MYQEKVYVYKTIFSLRIFERLKKINQKQIHKKKNEPKKEYSLNISFLKSEKLLEIFHDFFSYFKRRRQFFPKNLIW